MGYASLLTPRPEVLSGEIEGIIRIGREDRGHILAQIRRAGLMYVKFEAGPAGPVTEEESLGASVSREDVGSHLRQRLYPAQLLAEHLSARLGEIKGRPVREIDREYRSTLGFPVPPHAGSVTRAIGLLCKDGKLSLSHARGNYCGTTPELSERELLGEPSADRDIRDFLVRGRPCAVVLLDGLSLREIPMLLRLAEEGGHKVTEVGMATAAAPSETVDFIEQRLGIGRIGPSQLPGRQGLREIGVEAFYYDHEGRRHQLPAESPSLCLWSAFPDQTYQDSGARFANHFAELHRRLEAVWRNTVQAIPAGRTILVTSDHGYVFFGHGCSAHRDREAIRPLNEWFRGERWRRLGPGEEPPAHSDLAVIRERRLAMIRGRVQTHPPGPASSRLYKHGGLSLMEMLTPWIVLEAQPT